MPFLSMYTFHFFTILFLCTLHNYLSFRLLTLAFLQYHQRSLFFILKIIFNSCAIVCPVILLCIFFPFSIFYQYILYTLSYMHHFHRFSLPLSILHKHLLPASYCITAVFLLIQKETKPASHTCKNHFALLVHVHYIIPFFYQLPKITATHSLFCKKEDANASSAVEIQNIFLIPITYFTVLILSGSLRNQADFSLAPLCLSHSQTMFCMQQPLIPSDHIAAM